MRPRRPIMAGNWKMHLTSGEAHKLASEIVSSSVGASVDIVVAPAFTSLFAVREAVEGSHIEIAAQDMHWADSGAFTGAVSPTMVREFATRVILGHSERRQLFQETDSDVNRKVHAAFAHDLDPIVCVGESEAERDAGRTDAVVSRQITIGLDGLADDEVVRTVIAYEPVWAIGTGRACESGEAERVIKLIRRLVESLAAGAGEAVRIVYGGSVNPGNAAEYLGRVDIDGALVGGASLQSDSFNRLIREAGA